MIKPRTLFFILLGFLVSVRIIVDPTTALADQCPDVEEIESFRQAVTADFEQGRFKELEEMAKELRTGKVRFRKGVYKLTSFYDALQNPPVESDNTYKRHLELFDRWAGQFPESVTVRVARGGTLLSYAWFARGNGYADTVTDDGWRLFYERVDKAYEVLKDAPKSAADDDQQRFANMLTVALAQGWDWNRYCSLFDKAIALDPAYLEYYTAKMCYILPRWHGEEGEWLEFADDAVRLTPKTEGMTMYTRIVWGAWDMGEWKSFAADGISWPKMKQGFLDIEKNYPDSDWNLNKFAFFAFKANDWQTVDGLFDRIGETPCVKVWGNRQTYDTFRKIARDIAKRASGIPGKNN